MSVIILYSMFSQSIYVNETDINKLDIKYCELRVGQPLNPTKVKIFVDYGQAFFYQKAKYYDSRQKSSKVQQPNACFELYGSKWMVLCRASSCSDRRDYNI